MTSTNYLDKLLDPVAQALNPESARHLASLAIHPSVQERLDALADKSTEGELTNEQRLEYETYIHALDFLAVLQAQAKQRLNNKSQA